MEYVEEYDLLTLDFVSGFKINDASEKIMLYNHTEFYFRLTQFLYSSKGKKHAFTKRTSSNNQDISISTGSIIITVT